MGGIPIVYVVGSELKVPLELAGIGIECEQRIGIEIVAAALVAFPVGAGVAGAPVNHVEFGVVAAGHPSGGGTIFVAIAEPGFGGLVSRSGQRGESPGLLACFGFVRGEVAAYAKLATGTADDDFVFDDERRDGA